MSDPGMPSAERVCVVTITNADRSELVQQVVKAALREGVGKVVIVDNASLPSSADPIRSLAAESGGRIEYVRNDQNLGSAGGYKTGLAHALRSTGCDYVWLLDDDNRPEAGALSSLLEWYRRLAPGGPSDRLGLLSLRPDHGRHVALAQGLGFERVFPRRSSFLGFHVLDIPRKLSRLVGRPAETWAPNRTLQIARLPFAPWGGLFLHRHAIEYIGLPNDEFFLYAEDTEYTYRLTARGGSLFLVPSSLLADLERPWSAQARSQHLFAILLQSGSDLQVYYMIRNTVYFDLHHWALNRFTLELNKWVFMALLFAFGIWWRKWDRLALITQAVRDGENGKLGIRATGGSSLDR